MTLPCTWCTAPAEYEIQYTSPGLRRQVSRDFCEFHSHIYLRSLPPWASRTAFVYPPFEGDFL